MKDLTGKVAVITGGASGIGFGMARRFGAEGMKLVLADVERPALDKARAELEAEGCEVLAVPTDVADAEQMDALAERTLAEFGAVHLVCNNAGVAGGGVMWELSTQDWEFVLRVNLWGVIHGVRVFVKHLVAQGEGHIVNTASVAGLISVPGLGPYNVTKHAVVTLSETLFAELSEAAPGVGVSVLCPGFVKTRIYESDRNRPEHLGGPLPAEDEKDPEVAERRVQLAAFMATAMPPAELAQHVLDAVRERRFYILTHPAITPAIGHRVQRIVEGQSPAVSTPTIFSGADTEEPSAG